MNPDRGLSLRQLVAMKYTDTQCHCYHVSTMRVCGGRHSWHSPDHLVANTHLSQLDRADPSTTAAT
jgi:hypothetical protein